MLGKFTKFLVGKALFFRSYQQNTSQGMENTPSPSVPIELRTLKAEIQNYVPF